MKTCPFCRAEAPDDAPTCGACGKSFDQPEPVPAPTGDAPPAATPQTDSPAPEPTAPLALAPAPAAPTAQEITLTVCPQCKTTWQPGAVLCLSCGYDARVGRRLSTVHGVEEAAPVLRPTAGVGPVRTGVMLHAVRLAVLFATIFVGVVVAVLAVQIQNTETFSQPTQSLEEKALAKEPGEGPTSPAEATPPARPSYTTVVSALVLSLIAFGLALAQPVLGILGSLLCLWAPRAAKAKRWIVASLACDAGAFVALCALFAWAYFRETLFQLDPATLPAAAVVADWPLHLALLPVTAAWVLFMAFAGRMSMFYERKDEGAQAAAVIICGLAALTVIPLVLVPLDLQVITWVWIDPISSVIAYLISGALGLAWILFGIWVTYQVFGLCNAVRRALTPQPAEAAAEAEPEEG